MLDTLMTISLLSLFMIPIGLIWLITSFVMKKRKAIPIILITAGMLFFLTGIISYNTWNKTQPVSEKTGNYTIYPIKISKVKINDNNWEIYGSTEAPNGSRVFATTFNSENYYYLKQLVDTDLYNVNVKNHKYKITINPIDATDDTSYNKTKKIPVYIVAIGNYDGNSKISSRTKKVIKKHFGPAKFHLTTSQIAYYNSLNDNDDSNSSSSATDSDSKLSEQSNSSSVDKDASSAFSKSVSALAKNIGNSNNLSISAKVSDNGASVVYYVPESASSMSKDDKSTLASDLIPRTDKLADMCSVDQPTDIYIQTADTYKTIAKTTLTGGTKVY
ncbi:hypothetical protein ACPWRU_05625 [Lactiplantibacillus plantarum subsp. plantarum]|uniref:hypothetical protein n=1 Tax=Lactiplantibacillus plantarum TaxID=1590 RepID=UPI003F8037D4